jgi:hypothetical protein
VFEACPVSQGDDAVRSSCRACEAAFGCEAVVNPECTVPLKHRVA